MEYSKLVAVTGLPGLFELISSRSDGAVVRSLEDKKTQFVSSRVHNLSHLESIEVFTTRDNINLADLFHAMEKTGGALPDTKDAAAVKKYFEKVYPEMDFERIYPSDMKKMVKWFDMLIKNKVEIKLSEPEGEEQPAAAIEPPAEETAKKKSARKKKEE